MAILLVGLLHNFASAQTLSENETAAAIESKNEASAIPVAFPAIMSPKSAALTPALLSPKTQELAPASNSTALAAPLLSPVPMPALRRTPQAQSETATLVVSRMNGEVHFKHLGGPRLDPSSRALEIGTGGAQSWCEFKMNTCTGRVWKDSNVTVLPDSSTVILRNGSLIINIKGESGKYSILCGDLLCRAEATTLRVQRTDSNVSFQVLEGTVTVCRRSTGEIYTATQVVQPLKKSN